jgi:hypothetical protein
MNDAQHRSHDRGFFDHRSGCFVVVSVSGSSEGITG